MKGSYSTVWTPTPKAAPTLMCSAVQRIGFRGGLVFKARRLLYHSTLGLRVIKKNEDRVWVRASGLDPKAGDAMSYHSCSLASAGKF